MIGVRRGTPLALAALLLAGCGGDGDDVAGPVPGTLVVSLVTPAADDGALVLRLGGPGAITNVTAIDPALYLHGVEGGATVTVVLVGDLTGGEILEIDVPDVGDATRYWGSVVEVADRSNALRQFLGEYGLTLTRRR